MSRAEFGASVAEPTIIKFCVSFASKRNGCGSPLRVKLNGCSDSLVSSLSPIAPAFGSAPPVKNPGGRADPPPNNSTTNTRPFRRERIPVAIVSLVDPPGDPHGAGSPSPRRAGRSAPAHYDGPRRT